MFYVDPAQQTAIFKIITSFMQVTPYSSSEITPN
jgi:hypothetical protein